jgi:OOP family OmpA-OmpF porin
MNPPLALRALMPLTVGALIGVIGCSPAETVPAQPKAPSSATATPISPHPPATEVRHEPPPRPALPDKVTLDGTVLKHVSGVWKLTPEGQEIINKLAEKVRTFGADLTIEVNGYTSSTGTHAQNLTISRHRAECVAKALVGAGIPLNRITTRGLGPANPVAENSTHEGRLKNQRVEIQCKVP